MPISMFKFNMYAAMSRDNPWYGLMSGADQTDEEQDSIKVWDEHQGMGQPSCLVYVWVECAIGLLVITLYSDVDT